MALNSHERPLGTTQTLMDAQYTKLSADYSSKPESYYELSRPEMVPFVPVASKTILEVGCSSGAFGALLKEKIPDCEVWGIEPDPKSAAAAAKRLDRVISGIYSADTPELEGKRFDAICFNDVLEHLIDPERVLIESRKFLNENGVIVASIPNILFFHQISKILIEQDWRYEEFGILDSTHLRFFTKKSIVRLFESCGFDLIRVTGINPGVGLKFKILNFLALGWLSDWKFTQFAVQAKSKK
jgi:SAM-dependent methyltransferase